MHIYVCACASGFINILKGWHRGCDFDEGQRSLAARWNGIPFSQKRSLAAYRIPRQHTYIVSTVHDITSSSVEVHRVPQKTKSTVNSNYRRISYTPWIYESMPGFHNVFPQNTLQRTHWEWQSPHQSVFISNKTLTPAGAIRGTKNNYILHSTKWLEQRSNLLLYI